MIWAIIKLQFEGIHKWGKAPKSVAFLNSPHRHIFHITVFIEQNHTDRDVEYIQMKRFLSTKLSKVRALGTKSCEQVGQEIIHILEKKCPLKALKVKVMEDGENGCMIESGLSGLGI